MCDTPGFEDTNGPEVDISNGIGIKKAINQCKSVRPVVLISGKSIGDSGGPLKELAHIIVGMIKDCIASLNYIFTKFEAHEKSGMIALLEQIRKTLTLEDKLDTSFVKFFTDLCHISKQNYLCLIH